jgi:hypothetical protein
MIHKAIETTYNGYKFRSRLEARYAVLFDYLYIKYEYEKEGFVTEKGDGYLPDFWLPEHGVYVEIKGQELSELDQDKCVNLATVTKCNVLVFVGDLGGGDTHRQFELKVLTDSEIDLLRKNTGILGTPEKTEAAIGRGYAVAERWNLAPYYMLATLFVDPSNLDEYIRVMRSARFEHGQKGFVG